MVKALVLAVAGGAVLLVGCGLPARYVVPATEKGNECKRTCMQVELACYGAHGKDIECRYRENECLATCPGVIIPGAKPPEQVVEAPPPAPAPPPRQLGPPKCVASELPEWAGASAGQKKALLDRCRGE